MMKILKAEDRKVIKTIEYGVNKKIIEISKEK